MNSTRIILLTVLVLAPILGASGNGPSAVSRSGLAGGAKHVRKSTSDQSPVAQQEAIEDRSDNHVHIHAEVEAELERGAAGAAHALIKLRSIAHGYTDRALMLSIVKRQQENFLARTRREEFQASFRFETEPMMIGHLTKEGLAKLAADPDVVSIEPSKRLSANLS